MILDLSPLCSPALIVRQSPMWPSHSGHLSVNSAISAKTPPAIKPAEALGCQLMEMQPGLAQRPLLEASACFHPASRKRQAA